MIGKLKPKTYTVADLYTEATHLVREEMSSVKKKPLTAAEETKIKELAKTISNSVLREIRVI